MSLEFRVIKMASGSINKNKFDFETSYIAKTLAEIERRRAIRPVVQKLTIDVREHAYCLDYLK